MQLKMKSQAGATLIEIIMVVALIAIITIGALTYYNAASEGNRIQETVSGLTSLTSVIRNQFASQGHYHLISQDIVARFGNVPKALRLDDTDILAHSWNRSAGSIAIGPIVGTGSATRPSHFFIRMVGVPARNCMDIVTKTFKSFSVTVGAAPTLTTGGLATIATANTACGVGGESALVDINFVSR